MKRPRSYKQKNPITPQNNAALRVSEFDERASGNVSAMRVESEARRTVPLARGRQGGLEVERNDNGIMQISTDRLSHVIASVIREISKEAGGMASFSRCLVDDSIGNGQMAQPHLDVDIEENRRQLQQEQYSEYKQQELDAALEVIKKTMMLDAAEPFNRPVDPAALDIPDYFDVIKTPMDFGTICNNLENGLKYMNSADVFMDVQYIWHNCVIYNKPGDHILKLLKRVKSFFMKHWKAAGLLTEQSPSAIDVHPVTESSILRHNKRQNETPIVNNFTQLQNTEASQPQQSSSQQQFSISRHNKRQKESPLVNTFTQLQNPDTSQPQQSSSQQQSSPEKDEPNIDSRSTEKKRQIRGLAAHQKLLTSAGRIKVLTNELGQPVGPEAVKLTSFLGHIARDGNLAPLTCSGWRKMPEENKEKMWQKILTTFDIEPSCRLSVLLSIGSKWRNFKSQLKAAHYDTHATDEERLADRDERVRPDQWAFLVSQWSSDEFQRLSARNKANRAKVKFIHTSGTKSFARLLEEEREKRPDGQELSQAELFILTRTRKNGQPVNETSAAVISELRESANPEDAYHRVMGGDRERGNRGVSVSELNATRETIVPSRAEALKMVEEKNVEVVEMKERLASVEETCSQMAAQMSAMVSMMANMQKAFTGENIPNGIPVGRPNQSEPAFTTNHEVPTKSARGRKKRR
ncbi:putative chromatin remodeler Bromodomain family [Helianthus anomalus]